MASEKTIRIIKELSSLNSGLDWMISKPTKVLDCTPVILVKADAIPELSGAGANAVAV